MRSSITCNSKSNILAPGSNTTCSQNMSNFFSPELFFRELKIYLAVQTSQKNCTWQTHRCQISYIDLGKPKSVASVIYLDVVNNYTVIQHVKQIFHDFVVSAVSSQNYARKCAKSQVLFLPKASQSFSRP